MPVPFCEDDVRGLDGRSKIKMPYGLPSAPHAGTYNIERVAWLRWRKTRAEVFGHDVEPRAEGWAFHFIFPKMA